MAGKYLQVLSQSKLPGLLPAVLCLLDAQVSQFSAAGSSFVCPADRRSGIYSLQVCPRCCLRLAGVRIGYNIAAPSGRELHRAVSQSTAAGANVAEPSVSVDDFQTATAQPSRLASQISNAAEAHSQGLPVQDADLPLHSSTANLEQQNSAAMSHAHTTDPSANLLHHAIEASGANAAPSDQMSHDQQLSQQPADASLHPCSICLGVMQSVEGQMGLAASNTLLKKFARADNSPGTWTSLSTCSVAAVAEAVRCSYAPTQPTVSLMIRACSCRRFDPLLALGPSCSQIQLREEQKEPCIEVRLSSARSYSKIRIGIMHLGHPCPSMSCEQYRPGHDMP